MKNGTYVLVTTEFRGVFVGELAREWSAQDGKTGVTLRRARCAIRWGTDNGFLELASKGPNVDSKIGDEADEIDLYAITSVTRCTDAARDAFRNHRG